jgi:hypothetical protein
VARKLFRAERDENTEHECLTMRERHAAGERIAKLYESEMKERQGRPGKPRSSKLPEHRNGEPTETGVHVKAV